MWGHHFFADRSNSVVRTTQSRTLEPGGRGLKGDAEVTEISIDRRTARHRSKRGAVAGSVVCASIFMGWLAWRGQGIGLLGIALHVSFDVALLAFAFQGVTRTARLAEAPTIDAPPSAPPRPSVPPPSLSAPQTEAYTIPEQFRLMVESVADYAIFMLDPSGRVKSWNIGAQSIKGYSADEIIGRHISIFYSIEDQKKPHQELADAIANGRCEDEGWRLRKDGTRFWANVAITALRDKNGTLLGFVKITRDLSERKRVDDALRASLKEKQVLLQEVHHRVKNNLQVISSLLNLQAAKVADPHVRNVLRDSQSRVRSIALLHEGLYQSEDLARIDMATYVNNLVATLARTYGDASTARVVAEIDHVFLGVDAAIPCGLIVNELVTNALKHAFPAPLSADAALGEIRIEMHRHAEDVILTVRDNGAGYSGAVDPGKGGSLGLTLVRNLCRQISGNLTFDNQAGARCTVTFPILHPEAV